MVEASLPDSPIEDLSLDYSSSSNFWGQEVVKGCVESSHPYKIENVRIKIEGYDYSGNLVEEKEFCLDVDISPNGRATFKEYLSSKNISTVKAKITSVN